MWRTTLSALLALLTFLVAAPALASCRLQQLEIPVHMVDRRPVATLTLNGTEVPVLVDSGAFFSMLSESAAAQLKLPLKDLPAGFSIEGYTGPIAAKLTRVEKFGLLGVQLTGVEFVVGGNEMGAGIMGMMGRNILSIADAEYDLAHGVVRLSFPKGDCAKTNFAHWAGEAPVVEVPLDNEYREDTAIRVQVSINGKRTSAVLDTGAPQSALTLRAARRAGIQESDLTPDGRVGGAGEGRVRSWTGRVAEFELGGQKITNSRLQINDTHSQGEGMLLGLDYFLSHRIYVSRLQRKVYITWNGGPAFALSRLEPGNHGSRYAALPQDVAADNADALARRGAAAIAAGNHARALEDLNRACELAPGVADNFFARARLHPTMRQLPLALADLDKSLQLEPTLADARLRRAWVHRALGDRAAALADLAQLDAAVPSSSNVRADVARLYADLGHAAQALRQYDLWVSTHPKDARLARVLNERCWIRARMNIDLSLALDDCMRAVDLDAGEANHHDSLGWTYLRLGDAARAKRAFDGAIKLQALPFSLYGRGLAQLRMNNRAGAEQDLAAARKLQPSIDEDARKEGFEFVDEAARPAVAGS